MIMGAVLSGRALEQAGAGHPPAICVERDLNALWTGVEAAAGSLNPFFWRPALAGEGVQQTGGGGSNP